MQKSRIEEGVCDEIEKMKTDGCASASICKLALLACHGSYELVRSRVKDGWMTIACLDATDLVNTRTLTTATAQYRLARNSRTPCLSWDRQSVTNPSHGSRNILGRSVKYF